MSISTAKHFVAVLAKSRLLKPKHLHAVRGAAEKDPDPKALAGRLVRKGLLSRWQAKQLLAGHASFFLGAYRLIEPLSTHRGSHVYLAEHRTLGRRVVLKRLPREVMDDADRKERQLASVRAAVGLDHENLARVYSIEQAGDRYYVISQYVEGRDLAATVAESGPLAFADAAVAASQAAAGLAEAHRHKAVHGGVRPSNLVVAPDGQVKLVAVATARRYAQNAPDGSEVDAPAILDAVHYQAPELLKPEADPTPASDIYSLGCTLYSLLTGKPPFTEETAAELAASHMRHQPPGILRARPEAPDLLIKACRKMLAKRPEDRPGSADEVVEMLAELCPAKRSTARIVATVSARKPEDAAPVEGKSRAVAAGTGGADVEIKPVADKPVRPAAGESDPEADSEPSPGDIPVDAPKDKSRPATPGAKDPKPPANGKAPDRRQPAKAAPAAAKPAPKRTPARNAESEDKAREKSPRKDSGRKSTSPSAGAAFAIDTGKDVSPASKARSGAAKGKPSLATAAAGPGGNEQGFIRQHGKILMIAGGSIAALLLAAAISLPFVLGGSSGDRDRAELTEAEAPAPEPEKPARAATDNVVDELDLAAELDLDMDLGIDDLPVRRAPDRAPNEEPETPAAGEEPPAERPAGVDGDAEPAVPAEASEPAAGEGGGEAKKPEEPKEKPAEKPPAKPDPPQKEKPPTFRDLPEVAVLPPPGGAPGQPAPTEPMNLGKVYVRERAPWIVSLRGGDAVISNAEISLTRDAAEAGGRAYIFQLAPGNEPATAIARLWYVPENDLLRFQWLEAAAAVPGAALLRLCQLELNIDGEAKMLAFSRPLPAPPLEFDLDKKVENVTIESGELPDGKLLRLEITKVEGAVERFQTQPDGPVELRKPLGVAFQRVDRDRNAQPIATIQINFTAARNRLTITRRIDQPPRRMVQPGPQLAVMRQKGEEEFKKAMDQMKKADGHGARDKFRPMLNQIEQGLGHLDLVEKIDKQAKIHYRILLQAGGHLIPLFDSEVAGPAGQGPTE